MAARSFLGNIAKYVCFQLLQEIFYVKVHLDLRALGRGYTVGSAAKVLDLIFHFQFSACQVLYPAAGGSDDWALGGAGIPYSYTIG